MSEEPWKLYYYDKQLLQGGPGRAGFVRLMFEEAGVPYIEENERIYQLFRGGEWKGYPTFAPPLIQRGIWKYYFRTSLEKLTLPSMLLPHVFI